MGKVTEELAKSTAGNNAKKGGLVKRKGLQKEKKMEQQDKKELSPTKKMGQKRQKSGGDDEILKKKGSVSGSSWKNRYKGHFKLIRTKRMIDH